jgi:predicted dehydrogenase
MRIGLIGFGFMGGVHLAAIEKIEGASVTAVASRTRPTADGPARGNLHHLKTAVIPDDATWYSDWRQLLLDPKVDAVDICLPTHLHKEAVLSAFEHGKHVLCEKPMALTSADCDEMMAAAKQSGRVFMVAQVLRFMFPYQFAATFVSEGAYGPIEACTLSRRTGFPQWSDWLSKDGSSGGAVLDLLSHDIDQALKIFGMPKTVSAVSQGEIDTMVGTLYYANGLKVYVEGGWFAPEVPFSAGFEITAERATLSFAAEKLTLRLPGAGRPVTIPEQDDYLDELAYFVACCRDNVSPELCLPADSARAVQLANLLKASREQDGKELSCAL